MERQLRIFGAVVLVGLALATGLMLHNLQRYERAGLCSSASTVSRDCIVHTAAQITQAPEYDQPCTTDGTKCADVYRVRAQTAQGDSVKFTIIDERKDLEVGSAVELEVWNGMVISVGANGQVSHIWGWEPELARYCMLGTIPVLLVLAVAALVAPNRSMMPKNKTAKFAVGVLGMCVLMLSAFVVFGALEAFLHMGLLM